MSRIRLVKKVVGLFAFLFFSCEKKKKNNYSQENQEINIALITDSQYIIPTLVSMYSASVNKCPNSIYNYYIITENKNR